MKKHVFISHSSSDSSIANVIVEYLEKQGMACWIAPRSITPGENYAESIIQAIDDSTAMVLVFSDKANSSSHLSREVERAVNDNIPIIPFRIEDVIPTRSMEYYISSVQWLDAINPPFEQHLPILQSRLAEILRSSSVNSDSHDGMASPRKSTSETLIEASAPPSLEIGNKTNTSKLLTIGLTAAVVVAAFLIFQMIDNGRVDDPGANVADNDTELVDPQPILQDPVLQVSVDPEQAVSEPEIPEQEVSEPVDHLAAIQVLVQDWAQAWEQNISSIDAYGEFYHPALFQGSTGGGGDTMNLGDWLADKRVKARQTSCINVEVSEIEISVDPSETGATSVFTQRYETPAYCDSGQKTLQFFNDPNSGWKIIRETQPRYTPCTPRQCL